MPRKLDTGVRAEWSWEGNVQGAIARFLVAEGWQEPKAANAEIQGRGVDLETWLDERHLVIEVKGFPAKVYAAGPKAGKPKPTQPTLQASHWFSHALLSALTMRSRYPAAEVAIGLPNVPRYRSLLQQTDDSLRQLGIGVLLVAESDKVSWYLEPVRQGRTSPGVADLNQTFGQAGLAVPPVPAAFAATLTRRYDWCWSTVDIDPFAIVHLLAVPDRRATWCAR